MRTLSVRGACLALAQPLCERVRRHTDRKETGHAPRRWWRLLAKTDPVALTRLAARDLLRDCNTPNPEPHQALTDMWRSWHTRADPVLAGTLRLTLDTPLDPGDVEAIQRLADSEEATDTTDELMVWLLARADERPSSYSYPETADIKTRDQQLVDGLNAVAESAGLPPVTPEDGSPDASAGRPSPSGDLTHKHGPLLADLPVIPTGEAGLALSIRAWRKCPYRTDSPCWDIDEFAEEIVQRLTGLADAGCSPRRHSLASPPC